MSLLRKSANDAPKSALPPDTPAPATPPLETVQGNVHAGAAEYANADVVAAHPWLAPLRAPAEAGIRRHEAWRQRPVEPRPDLGEDFDRYETVDALLAHARLQQAAGCPESIWTPFATALGHVQGEVDDPANAKKALAAETALTAKQCARPEAYRVANRWPPGCYVESLANALGVVANRTDDTLNAHARALAVQLQTVLRWSRGQAARSLPPAAPIRVGSESEAQNAVTRFNPFTGQAYY